MAEVNPGESVLDYLSEGEGETPSSSDSGTAQFARWLAACLSSTSRPVSQSSLPITLEVYSMYPWGCSFRGTVQTRRRSGTVSFLQGRTVDSRGPGISFSPCTWLLG
jgi:hypothetical protein